MIDSINLFSKSPTENYVYLRNPGLIWRKIMMILQCFIANYGYDFWELLNFGLVQHWPGSSLIYWSRAYQQEMGKLRTSDEACFYTSCNVYWILFPIYFELDCCNKSIDVSYSIKSKGPLDFGNFKFACYWISYRPWFYIGSNIAIW